MLGRRRRRRANIDPTLVQCLVFAGLVEVNPYNAEFKKKHEDLYVLFQFEIIINVLFSSFRTIHLNNCVNPYNAELKKNTKTWRNKDDSFAYLFYGSTGWKG